MAFFNASEKNHFPHLLKKKNPLSKLLTDQLIIITYWILFISSAGLFAYIFLRARGQDIFYSGKGALVLFFQSVVFVMFDIQIEEK